jgi:predicted nucleotidyltransferase component of viral defense system
MRKPIRNKGASVRARLLKLAKERNQPFDLLLTRYVLERFLYRLGKSKQCKRFVLKGAMLMMIWLNDALRPTRDVDLLGFGDPDPDDVIKAFHDVCAIKANDAVTFDIDKLAVDRIRGGAEYSGLRVKTDATVDGARVRVVIDIGFGDSVEPGLTEVDLPVLLDFPAPHLRAYARETVIAEKFQAMVVLGRANSRMKDFYDIWLLSRSYEFKGDKLARAIAATFARRKTALPVKLPDALSRAFAEDPAKMQQWTSFVINMSAQPRSLAHIIDDLAQFLMPYVVKAVKQAKHKA